MNQEAIWFLKSLIIPPGGLVILGLLGLMLSRRFFGKLLLLVTLASLYLLSTPFISRQLISSIETVPPINLARLANHQPQAIVVLGGGRHTGAPEYGSKDTVNSNLLERLRYAAWLSRDTGLPIIPSGGSGLDEGEPEADMSRRILEKEFGRKVLAVENKSRTTQENAQLTKALLDKLMIKQVLLVTHAWHMPRALEVFEQAGIQAIPAPTGFNRRAMFEPTLKDWRPEAVSLGRSSTAIHERLGKIWYQLKDWTDI
ncbi:YdcF family protein [Solemya velesiana gill symbiont]|uniref:DUF218 domain-containing protein n=1 Tax=Solemya velesiana gill symbiont TaxID=1918948 RepID=A0A1T2KY66_9GAMM|nr:YdcF family protein [Solemya velesiana gill symbiont]OOZ37799.1 hypothetical protein BOW51_00600 [Solemya velesiana gill symbiont]